MLVVDVVIEGTRPILLHNPQGMARQSGANKGKNIPTPEDEAAAGCYWTKDKSSLMFPGDNLKQAMIAASGQYKVGKKSVTPFVAGALDVEPFEVPFNTKDYEIDLRRAIVQRNGVLRARPKIWPWKLEFKLLVEEEDFPIKGQMLLSSLRDILEEAGRRIGIADYRPQKRGWFGKFKVTRFELITA